MAITLEQKRLDYKDYFKWFDGDFATLFNVPPTLVNGLALLDNPKDLKTKVNYFGASSRYYINAIVESIPSELEPYFKMVERMVKHWAVTGEYCLVIENGVINTIRPDYVFPIRKEDNYDIIQGYYFVFPQKDSTTARVIHYDIVTGKAYQTIRTLAGNHLADASGGTELNIQAVFYEDTGTGYYNDIEGIVRELNIRFPLIQYALNSTTTPLLQVALEGIAGGLVSADGITPANIASLGKTGLGLVIPPPFTGEEGARYIERSGVGLDETINYIRMLFGVLTISSGVPEYVYGVSISQTSAEVQRVMFMGESRINRVKRALRNTFLQLGIDVEFPQSQILPNEVVEVEK